MHIDNIYIYIYTRAYIIYIYMYTYISKEGGRQKESHPRSDSVQGIKKPITAVALGKWVCSFSLRGMLCKVIFQEPGNFMCIDM